MSGVPGLPARWIDRPCDDTRSSDMPMTRRFGRLLPWVLLGLLAAPSLPAQTLDPPAAQGAGPALVEHYRVGDDVYVRAFALDERRNSLWVGTSTGALEVDLDSKQVKNTFTRKDGLANEYVFAIGVEPDGPVWFGTNAGGASTYEEGVWRTYFPMHGLADYWVYAFAFAADGVWIGTWDGVNLYDASSDRFTTYREELINIWVYGIDIDSTGRVWFGTEGGVSMLDHGAWRSWTHDDGLGAANTVDLPASGNTGLGTSSRHDLSVNETYNPNYVFSVLVDQRDDSIWFGTWGGGVSRFDGAREWTSFTQEDGLAGNIVYSIAQEPDGALWFGTNHGVTRYDGKTWAAFDRRDGLIGDHVYAVVVAADGSTWLGSKGGVTRLVYRDKGESK